MLRAWQALGIPQPPLSLHLYLEPEPLEVLAHYNSEAVMLMASLRGRWRAECWELGPSPAAEHGGPWKNRAARHLTAHPEFRLQRGRFAITLHGCLSRSWFSGMRPGLRPQCP